MSSAQGEHSRFPVRKREYSGPRVGPFILGFAVLLGVAVVYLSVEDRLGPGQIGVLVFLMLAALIGYGAIGEDTFKGLVERLLDKLPGGGKGGK